MFESAELRHEVGKAAYQREQASLRAALLNAQYDLKLDGRFPVLVLIAGVEGAGKGETVNLLNEWMDPRDVYKRQPPGLPDRLPGPGRRQRRGREMCIRDRLDEVRGEEDVAHAGVAGAFLQRGQPACFE